MTADELLDVLTENDEDDSVEYYEDGCIVDEAVVVLRELSASENDELSQLAQDKLALVLAARARYRS